MKQGVILPLRQDLSLLIDEYPFHSGDLKKVGEIAFLHGWQNRGSNPELSDYKSDTLTTVPLHPMSQDLSIANLIAEVISNTSCYQFTLLCSVLHLENSICFGLFRLRVWRASSSRDPTRRSADSNPQPYLHKARAPTTILLR